MKVVINKEIGGFALSAKAFKRLIELGMTLETLNEDGRCINKNADLWKTEDWKEYNKKLDVVEVVTHYGFVKSNWDISIRTNPLVIQVVEELGQDAAEECTLKIVEVPDGTDCEIGISDCGTEWIYEKHRTWR